MIDAREARIVYEENEYKNGIRDILEAQKKAEEEAKAREERMKRASECEAVLQPFYDKIAEAAADGYNQILVYISDFYYKEVCWSDSPYWGKINIRPLSYSLCGGGNIPTQRHNFSQFVSDVLESHGYTVKKEEEMTFNYNGYDILTIKW